MWIDDQVMSLCHEQLVCCYWVPERSAVVLGSSNREDVECVVEQCRADGVEILRRYGGGGAVVLHAGCLVVSVGCWVEQHFHNDRYFKALNGAVIECLQELVPNGEALGQRGISDITMGNRKIAGTSMFRSRNYLLYQASLLVDARVELFNKYLAHPSKEPDYRQGRAHDTFVTGLNSAVPALSAQAVCAHFDRDFRDILVKSLNLHLIAPANDQIPVVRSRALGRAR